MIGLKGISKLGVEGVGEGEATLQLSWTSQTNPCTVTLFVK